MLNYFRYFPAPRSGPPAACWAASCGSTHIRAGRSYPPQTPRHPRHHDFSWARGRVLDALQIVWIESGRGVLETARAGRRRIEGPCLFLLHPGVWHRYRPDPATGWVEHWLELLGPAVDAWRAGGLPEPARPLVRRPSFEFWREAFASVHATAQRNPAALALRLGAAGMQMLLELAYPTPRPRAPSRGARRASEAQELLHASLGAALRVRDIPRRLGMSYSHFRRTFREHTGLAPRQYLLELRHRSACRLLQETDMTLQQVADALAYHSAFHLSADFKRRMGQAPSQWRATQAGPA